MLLLCQPLYAYPQTILSSGAMKVCYLFLKCYRVVYLFFDFHIYHIIILVRCVVTVFPGVNPPELTKLVKNAAEDNVRYPPYTRGQCIIYPTLFYINSKLCTVLYINCSLCLSSRWPSKCHPLQPPPLRPLTRPACATWYPRRRSSSS